MIVWCMLNVCLCVVLINHSGLGAAETCDKCEGEQAHCMYRRRRALEESADGEFGRGINFLHYLQSDWQSYFITNMVLRYFNASG